MHLSFIPLFLRPSLLIHTWLENSHDLSSLLIRAQVNHKDRGLIHKRVINCPAGGHSSVPTEGKRRPTAISEFRIGNKGQHSHPSERRKKRAWRENTGRWMKRRGRKDRWRTWEKHIQEIGKDIYRFHLAWMTQNRWDYLRAIQAHYLHINDRWGEVVHGKSISFLLALVEGCFESH